MSKLRKAHQARKNGKKTLLFSCPQGGSLTPKHLVSHVNSSPLVHSGSRAVFVLRTELYFKKFMLKASILSSLSFMHTVGTLAYLS